VPVRLAASNPQAPPPHPRERGLVIELDVYGGALPGLVVAEVEFDSEQASESFVPPPWLGREVTEDAGYKDEALVMR
jgi:adenylate cyclase